MRDQERGALRHQRALFPVAAQQFEGVARDAFEVVVTRAKCSSHLHANTRVQELESNAEGQLDKAPDGTTVPIFLTRRIKFSRIILKNW